MMVILYIGSAETKEVSISNKWSKFYSWAQPVVARRRRLIALWGGVTMVPISPPMARKSPALSTKMALPLTFGIVVGRRGTWVWLMVTMLALTFACCSVKTRVRPRVMLCASMTTLSSTPFTTSRTCGASWMRLRRTASRQSATLRTMMLRSSMCWLKYWAVMKTEKSKTVGCCLAFSAYY